MTLPFTEQEFWVFTLATCLIGLSLLTFRLGRNRARSKGLPQNWLANTLITFASFLAPIWAALIGLVLYGLWQIAMTFGDFSSENDLRWHVLALVGLLTALGGLLATPLAMIRVMMTERQTKATEEGHITDRINKAVEGLGAEKTVKRNSDETTEPNLEVRIGALYALERISQDSARDHIQIMEILCAYIRQNAARNSPPLPEEELTPKQWHEWGETYRIPPPIDVDIALRIIERRSEKAKKIEQENSYRLGLEYCPLFALDLRKRDLSNADLSFAVLYGTDLSGANLANTILHVSFCDGADLSFSSLKRADLYFTRLRGADLMFAELDTNTQLYRTDFSLASISGVDLRETNINQAQIESSFGDPSTLLPPTITQPPHWPPQELDFDAYETAWRDWQTKIGFQPDQ